jgi:sugar phosphate isomerase/epimerase
MSGYQRAFSTLGSPDASVDGVLEIARSRGLQAVELRALGGSVDLPAVLEAAEGSPEALAGRLRGSPVRIASLDTSLHLVGGEAERDKFLEFVPWAEALGVRWLRVFDGGKQLDEAALEEAAATVDWWRILRRANGWKVDIMVETHDSLTDSEAIRRFIAEAPGTAILWDAFNTWLRSGESPTGTWAAIRPHVVHVHVKDATLKPFGQHPFTYVLPGRGEFPMKPIAAALRSGFRGVVSLEWERLWHPYLPPVEEALDAAAAAGWW